MVTLLLQPLTDCSNPITPLKPSLLNSLFSSTTRTNIIRHCKTSRTCIIPRASLNRRHLIADTAAAISIAPFVGFDIRPAKSEEQLSEWERVFLPIDPGVVLLDIAFVPDDPSHGLFVHLLAELFFDFVDLFINMICQLFEFS